MNQVRFLKMARLINLLLLACVVVCRAEDLRDFEFESDADEVMIAQESRHYQTIVKPPLRIFKPSGVTNSHRPQYNLDSLEHYDFEDFMPVNNIQPSKSLVKNYKSSATLRAKERMANEAVKRAIERKDHVGKFAQILPIIRAMSSSQRLALASLVANQVTTPPGRTPMNLAQVRSMFGNTNTTDLMLPILLDMANLVRRAIRPGKLIREVVYKPHTGGKPNILRGFYTGETHTDEKIQKPRGIYTETHTEENIPTLRGMYTETHTEGKKSHILRRSLEDTNKLRRSYTEDSDDDDFFDIGVETAPTIVTHTLPQRNTNTKTNTEIPKTKENSTKVQENNNSTKSTTTTEPSPMMKSNVSRSMDNSNHDLMADSTNQTLASDLPVAEKLRALNRYVDRKGALIRRGTYPPKLANVSSVLRRPAPDPALRRRPAPPRKLPLSDQSKCELFTNSLCLHADDYPTEAIVQSIRRNKAAAGALLADFKDPGEGALDGVTAAQESKYTAEHYLVSTNRRGDTANRDFASAGEAGFMCPSSVKYARPQRARATSGHWKYIVNTGEHTQTLRLEKCLKPKESCTYLTDNFKSKCVQVYNYHRLLTWDQQNGLHMDIFKVPTCCSCHIEGYSVNFPPVGHRIHETSSEHFPGEDLSSEHGNHAFEAVQSSIQRPTINKSPPFSLKKPESYPPFDTTQNLISGVPFSKSKIKEDIEESDPMDSYGNSYFPDSFNQASSIRNVRRPSSARSPVSSNADSMTLPSYLEPPTPSATNTFTIIKDSPTKYKSNPSQFKRGAFRPSRRPIRKKIGGPDDLTSSGSSAVESFSNSNMETMEDFNDYIHEPQIGQATVPVTDHKVVLVTIAPKLHAATSEKISTKTHTHRTQEQKQSSEENITSDNKRINYNYHPIIDFFETEGKEDESIDREDIESTFVPSIESEWKPINHLPTRNIPTTNQVSRKKHR